eukprot:TRINITY_DN1021_c2_g1_i2.p1 TRINITY_DN1021_c2_g1~~TRINITY_DN1021_c2_g1_i2.p1  ORF type:complete len:769 (-),score=340.00 TRINITY_DN1021_c2_g1_i2:106-2361(-)
MARRNSNMNEDQIHPCSIFRGWNIYFNYQTEDFQRTLSIIEVLYDAILKGTKDGSLTTLEETAISYYIDFNALKQLITESQFSKALEERPEYIISCIGVAIFQVFRPGLQPQPGLEHLNKINIRLKNYEPITHLKEIKSNRISQLVCVRGTVIRVANVRQLVTQMFFTCNKCGSPMLSYFEDGRYNPPTTCKTPQCKSRSFQPERNSAASVDWQKIKLQELDDDQRGSGRMPRTIEVDLTEDLVDSCVPGDIITVCGIVKAINSEEDRGRITDKTKGYHVLYIQANSIENNKQLEAGKVDLMQFTIREMYFIQHLASQKEIFKIIVNSICPSIYGNEVVKAGLTLALFGGSQKYAYETSKIAIRGDPHVLVVGDPGMGKSQMLQAVSKLAPRGVFVCGSYSSTSGLTVTLLKEKGSGDFALEAGALVLADQGVCCIDEFDKMSKEHAALLESMEQQSVSIAKAGICCTLPARASVIAAANPVGGHYNRAKTVCENLKMSSAILSRFDLIFILLDKPDQQRDLLLSEHVMAIHANAQTKSSKKETIANLQNSQQNLNNQQNIGSRLRITDPEFNPIPPQLLRKYIGYARKYVSPPKMTAEASLVLKEFYLTLREQHKSSDSTPITTRQLEAMIRLSEARAKLELREVIIEQDALDVIQIMKESMFDLFQDEFGFVDFSRAGGMSNAAQKKRFVDALMKWSNNHDNIFSTQQLKFIAEQVEINVDIDNLIESLNIQNILLKKGSNTYYLAAKS